MDTAIANILICIDEIVENLRSIGSKTKLPRTVRTDYVRNRRIERFRSNLSELRTKWIQSLNELIKYDLRHRITDIAEYMMKELVNTRLELDLEDEYCKSVIESIVKPLVGGIMDETELSLEANLRQESRKSLVFSIIIIRPKIKLPNVDERSTQSTLESQQSSENQEGLNISQQSDCNEPYLYTWEAKQVLDLLFEAITKHSQNVSKKDSDMISRIYHIMNITYIVDIIGDFLRKLKMDLLNPKKLEGESKSCVRLEENILEKFLNNITSNLEMFRLGTPFVIFRNDLRMLLIQLKHLKIEMNNNTM